MLPTTSSATLDNESGENTVYLIKPGPYRFAKRDFPESTISTQFDQRFRRNAGEHPELGAAFACNGPRNDGFLSFPLQH